VQGDYEQAEALFREALALRETALGRDSLEVAESLNNLAGAVRLQGRLGEAEEATREALAIRRARLSADHPLVTQSVSNLAVLHVAQGQLEQAEPLLRESIATNREVLGPNHPDLASDLSNLASTLQHLGRLAEAEDPWLECLDIRRRTLPGTPLLALTERQYGRLLVELGRLDEAEPVLLDVAPVVLGFEPGRTDYAGQLLRTLVELYEQRGDTAAAAHWAEELQRRAG